jgi:hypothetical protein
MACYLRIAIKPSRQLFAAEMRDESEENQGRQKFISKFLLYDTPAIVSQKAECAQLMTDVQGCESPKSC